MRPLCQLARIDSEQRLPGLGAHTQSCLRCQARIARDRRLHRQLQSLRDVEEVAPLVVAAEVERRIRRLEAMGARPAGGLMPRLAAGGAVAATAVGAGAVLLWRNSHPVA